MTHHKYSANISDKFELLVFECSRQFRKVKGGETNKHKITTLEDYVLMSVEVWRRSIKELGLSVNKPVGFRLGVTRRGCDRRLRKFKNAEVL